LPFLQTSFYAQGVIFGAVLFIAIASYARGVSDGPAAGQEKDIHL
jgi:hypothetical protein